MLVYRELANARKLVRIVVDVEAVEYGERPLLREKQERHPLHRFGGGAGLVTKLSYAAAPILLSLCSTADAAAAAHPAAAAPSARTFARIGTLHLSGPDAGEGSTWISCSARVCSAPTPSHRWGALRPEKPAVRSRDRGPPGRTTLSTRDPQYLHQAKLCFSVDSPCPPGAGCRTCSRSFFSRAFPPDRDSTRRPCYVCRRTPPREPRSERQRDQSHAYRLPKELSGI